MTEKPKRHKYGAKKCVYNGIAFDSMGERDHYFLLLDKQKNKEISNLKLQVKFPLEVNGVKICDFIADFTYTENRLFVVDDFKGILTDVFRLKAKLFKAIYGYDIRISKRKPQIVKRKKVEKERSWLNKSSFWL